MTRSGRDDPPWPFPIRTNTILAAARRSRRWRTRPSASVSWSSAGATISSSGSYAPGKWTARLVLVHLAQIELALGTRSRFALTQSGYTVQPFSQDDWMALENNVDAGTALAAYLSMRRMNLALWRTLTPEQLNRPLVHPDTARSASAGSWRRWPATTFTISGSSR